MTQQPKSHTLPRRSKRYITKPDEPGTIQQPVNRHQRRTNQALVRRRVMETQQPKRKQSSKQRFDQARQKANKTTEPSI